MSVTLAGLLTSCAQDLRDTGNNTFSTGVLTDLINSAISEIGRICPGRFRVDITPVADQLDYRLRRMGSDLSLTTPYGSASTDTLTCTAHGLTATTPIRFVSIGGGAGITVGTTYYVIASGLTSSAFKVSTASGGSTIDVTTDVSYGSFYAVIDDDPIPEIDVMRVEVLDTTDTPWSRQATLRSRYGERSNSSAAGWEVWNGTLSLTEAQEENIDPTTDILRVWGYAPYAELTASPANTVTLSLEQEYALRDYVRIEAIKMLLASRELYSQWQTTSRNSDVSLGQLSGLYAQAEASWKRRSRAMATLREAAD
jgi:hypothetical protein